MFVDQAEGEQMPTRLPLSLMVELAVDCSTKYSVPSALMNSGGGLSSAIAVFPHSRRVPVVSRWPSATIGNGGRVRPTLAYNIPRKSSSRN